MTSIVDKGKVKLDTVGLGVESENEQAEDKNDIFTLYKRRMRYAYRSRPSTTGNPRQT